MEPATLAMTSVKRALALKILSALSASMQLWRTPQGMRPCQPASLSARLTATRLPARSAGLATRSVMAAWDRGTRCAHGAGTFAWWSRRPKHQPSMSAWALAPTGRTGLTMPTLTPASHATFYVSGVLALATATAPSAIL